MKDELLKLAERVEALDGPDREVDEAIFWFLYPRGTFDMPEQARCVPSHIQSVIPQYTASLDAAMSLVPECREWHAGKHFKGGGSAYILCSKVLRDPIYATAATPALALVAASLRALAGDQT